jgi:glycosyltransferase involved in cell wall biosynthesis
MTLRLRIGAYAKGVEDRQRVTARRLLVVTYYFPPIASTGSNRWDAMVRHLRMLGHEVTVVTAAPPSGLPGVVSTADLRRLELMRRLLGRPPLAGLREGEPIDVPAPALFTRVLVPDMFVGSWAPFALRTVRRLLRSQTFDCLITTSPPESTHLVGLALGRGRPPWLVDLRDGWSFEPYREPFPTLAQRRLDARMERAVMRAADGHVAVTRPIAADLRTRFGVDSACVPNGFDPHLLDQPSGDDATEYGADTVRLVHTGRLSRVRGRDPRPLFEALALALGRDPVAGRTLRLVLIGPIDGRERELVKAFKLETAVEMVGPVRHSSALASQRAADALLLVTSADGSEATGKIFEYIGARRPIVALAGENEAARIVRETRSGVVVQPEDVRAIADVLVRVARGENLARPTRGAIERYRYPAPAHALTDQVERAIERRGPK